jgi:hypothetical protein
MSELDMRVVVSIWSKPYAEPIWKYVCSVECDDEDCPHAHPNDLGSHVLHPKWCLRGCRHTCNDRTCPFNHMHTEKKFVSYRMRDPRWAAANEDVINRVINSIETSDDEE